MRYAVLLTTAGSFRTSVYASCELWTWGDNDKGQLGHGDLLSRSQPCRVQYFDDLHIQSISTGAYHSMALLTNASVYLWGSNESYQLGDGVSTICSTPFKFQVFIYTQDMELKNVECV